MQYRITHLYKLAAQHGMQVTEIHHRRLADARQWGVMVGCSPRVQTGIEVHSPAFHAFEVSPDGTPALTSLVACWYDDDSYRGVTIDDLVRRLMDYIESGLEPITAFDDAYPDPENWPKPSTPSIA